MTAVTAMSAMTAASPDRPITDDRREFAATLRALLDRWCPPRLVRDLGQTPESLTSTPLWRQLADTGVFGLVVAEKFGGAGGQLDDLAVVAMEGGRTLLPLPVLNTAVFAVAIQSLAATELAAALLPEVVAGQCVGQAVLADPGDAERRIPTVTATRVPGGWTLSGRIWFVDAAADLLLLTAASDTMAAGTVLGFVLDPAGAGCEREPLPTIAGAGHVVLDLREMFVAEDRVLDGPGGNGLADTDLAAITRLQATLGCLDAAGGCAAVIDRTAEHLRTREQFGRPIGSFQAAQHLVADMHIAAARTRLTALAAARALTAGRPARHEVAVATIQAARAYPFVTLTAHQLHGGIGFVRETDLHLWSERAKLDEILGGSAEVALGWLAEEVVGR